MWRILQLVQTRKNENPILDTKMIETGPTHTCAAISIVFAKMNYMYAYYDCIAARSEFHQLPLCRAICENTFVFSIWEILRLVTLRLHPVWMFSLLSTVLLSIIMTCVTAWKALVNAQGFGSRPTHILIFDKTAVWIIFWFEPTKQFNHSHALLYFISLVVNQLQYIDWLQIVSKRPQTCFLKNVSISRWNEVMSNHLQDSVWMKYLRLISVVIVYIHLLKYSRKINIDILVLVEEHFIQVCGFRNLSHFSCFASYSCNSCAFRKVAMQNNNIGICAVCYCKITTIFIFESIFELVELCFNKSQMRVLARG